MHRNRLKEWGMSYHLMNSSLPPTQRVKVLDDDEPIKTIADAKREAKDKPVHVGVNT